MAPSLVGMVEVVEIGEEQYGIMMGDEESVEILEKKFLRSGLLVTCIGI